MVQYTVSEQQYTCCSKGNNGYKKYLSLNSFTQQYDQASQGFQYNTESPEIEGTEELVDTRGA